MSSTSSASPVSPLAPSTYNAPTATQQPSRWRTLLDKVWKVVKTIIIYAASATLCFFNPIAFVAAFLVGAARCSKVDDMVDRVIKAWRDHSYILIPLSLPFVWMAWEVVLLAGTVVFAAKVGRMFADWVDGKAQTGG